MAHQDSPAIPPADGAEPVDRRSMSLTAAAMTGGLLAGYGMFGYIAARFLYPARGPRKGWLFVARASELELGSSIRYRTPGGASVNITRRGTAGSVDDFIALSSVCPHLGCQVHWQGDQNRYFCPCHNGTFDPDGKGTGGPPGDAGQSLPRFSLKIDQGLLYIEVPMETLASRDASGEHAEGEIVEPGCDPEGPGHDPCLQPRRGDQSIPRPV